MRILEIDRERDLALCALVSDPAGRESVEIALVHPVCEGDELLVHAGTAIARTGVEPAPTRSRPRTRSGGGGG